MLSLVPYEKAVRRLSDVVLDTAEDVARAQKLLRIRAEMIERLCSVREMEGHRLRAQAELLDVESKLPGTENPVHRLDYEGRRALAQARMARSDLFIQQYTLEMDMFLVMAQQTGEGR